MSYANPIWAEKQHALQEVHVSDILILPILLKAKISLKVYILAQKIAFFSAEIHSNFIIRIDSIETKKVPSRNSAMLRSCST